MCSGLGDSGLKVQSFGCLVFDSSFMHSLVAVRQAAVVVISESYILSTGEFPAGSLRFAECE